MKMGAKVTGIDELRVELRYKAKKVPDNARKVMHRGADQIAKEAKLNAPVDDGELEDSIHIEKGYEESGRLMVVVAAGGVVRGVDVDRYATLVHENYEGMLKHGPGPNTLAKMRANPGRKIGSKFLERARRDVEPKLKKAMIKSVTEEMES